MNPMIFSFGIYMCILVIKAYDPFNKTIYFIGVDCQSSLLMFT